MSALSLLKNSLVTHSIPFHEDGVSLTVKTKTKDGFDVSMIDGDSETTVFFEGWHEHFSSPEEAVKCFKFGLSKSCRICVTQRGGKAHKWTLEAFEDGEWVSYGTTGLLFFQFWRSPTTRYLQNDYGT